MTPGQLVVASQLEAGARCWREREAKAKARGWRDVAAECRKVAETCEEVVARMRAEADAAGVAS